MINFKLDSYLINTIKWFYQSEKIEIFALLKVLKTLKNKNQFK